jgi:hypothetical protein
MAIRFYNIRSGEELVAENEPQIAALWGSSDRSPNVSQGQDFGWRFAPEVVVEMKQIMADPAKIQEIANRFRIMYEDVGETDVLTWISNKTELMAAPVANSEDYSDDYAAEIKRLEAESAAKAQAQTAVETTTQVTTESLADMEKRAKLAERIAKATEAAAGNDAAAENSTSKTPQ